MRKKTLTDLTSASSFSLFDNLSAEIEDLSPTRIEFQEIFDSIL